jgi:glycosyltransferase involved in cell wall biosynthesis
MINVVHIDGLNGINYHRLIVPLRRLTQQGVFFHWIQSLNELKDMNLDMVDNLIISRKASVNKHKEFSKMLKQHGIRLILDNDDYWELNTDNPAKGLYDVYYGPDIKKTIKIADVIWTPSRYLAKEMRKLNKTATIEFVNNAIDDTEEQWSKQRKYPFGALRFGYMGALGHLNDLKQIGYDFKKVYTYGVKGMEYDDILKYNKTSAPRDIWNYAKLYRSTDVSLVPLSDNKFNLCKSDLKVTEAAITRTAIITSNIIPYNETVIHGETGLLCSSPEEWAWAIDSMDKDKAQRLADNLHEALKDSPNHNLDLVNLVRMKYLA